MTIPTALSPRECALMRRVATGQRVVEAGALLGASTILLAKVASKLTSIDRHEGYSGPTLRPFLHHLHHFGVAGNVDVRVGEAALHLPTVAADVAFIDLTGTLDVTLQAMWATTASILMIHDTQRQHCDGVAKAIALAGGRAIAQADTLSVVWVPKQRR